MIKTYTHQVTEDADNTLNNILDIIVEGTWDWNGNTGQVDRSPGWFRMLGYEIGILNKDVFTWENIIHPDDYERVMATFELVTTGKISEYCIEYRCKKSDNNYLWIADRAKVIEHNQDGTVARMIGAHQDINEQKIAQTELFKQNQLLKAGNVTLENIIRIKAEELEKANKELKEKMIEVERISNTDPLTGIANRKKFEADLKKEISRADRYSHSLALVIFDIDFFKRINDTLGHKAGDNVLRKITQLVLNHIRDIDFFARWGGEEFVLILPCRALQHAIMVSEKLRMLISQYEVEPDLFITCSFGVTEYGQGDTIESLFHRVDKALYRAKDLGRNKVEIEIKDEQAGNTNA
ncbi:sensor domain-containing diguanylate cyclase [Pseudocolwellia agarivorans]|uniref:sensor domain-containing diguanylate cyclase n=1 Tax=Pseudocolwellia agarivorans TaxID=1911682 RepID=UPI0009870DDF|nr:sensor domain-containing diguanylate cyclase [Pseudocolwellia agarivorans]